MSDILMPKLSATMEEGTISKWCKSVGDAVELGEVIAEVETDKSVLEIEADQGGVLKEIFVEEGAPVSVGTIIARVEG